MRLSVRQISRLVQPTSPASAEDSCKLQSGTVKEPATENADCQETAKNSQRLVAFAAFSFPVHIAQIKPQRKLVKRQGRGDPVDHGCGSATPARAGSCSSS